MRGTLVEFGDTHNGYWRCEARIFIQGVNGAVVYDYVSDFIQNAPSSLTMTDPHSLAAQFVGFLFLSEDVPTIVRRDMCICLSIPLNVGHTIRVDSGKLEANGSPTISGT
jgi:hypothetical protein